MTTRRTARRGATAVESAVVLSVVFLLAIGLTVGGIGVFRYIQVAGLAREGARWTSVRGGGYQRDTNLPSPTAQQIAEQGIYPYGAGIDPAALVVRVEWVDRASNTATDWDAAPKDVRSITPAGETVTNAVRVTVTCQWLPGPLGNVTAFSSVCETPMSN